MKLPLLFIMVLGLLPVWGQSRGGAHALYERVIAIVPVNGAGSGSADDPKRPLFTPSPAEAKAAGRAGIISWHYEVSDDGKWAIVELVATNRAALQPLLSTHAPGVSVLQRGKNSREEIESAVKRLKKDFDLDRFAARVQGSGREPHYSRRCY